MINTQIRQFKESIVAITNTCPLPIEVKRLVFSEVLSQISQAANEMIAREKQQAESEKAEQSETDSESEKED